MNKFLLFVASALVSGSTFAQMPNGSTGPDFNSTDINGNAIQLYADFLDQGIPVIMDISATWCGPCWSFHESHAMKDLFMTYGTAGSNEIGVIFVEGDASTDINALNGVGNTQGDWVTGTPYPILDDANIASIYQISYYPTIYGICPDRTVYEIQNTSMSGLMNGLITNCNSVTSFTGAQDNIGVDEGSASVCIPGGDVTPEVTVNNFGTNIVTSMTAELFEAGNPTAIDVQNWSGALAAGGSTNVQFSALTGVAGAANYTVTVSNPNGVADAYPTMNTSGYTIGLSGFTNENTVTFRLMTDFYANETSFTVKDGNGNVLASDGPWPAGTADSFGGGGTGANQTYDYPLTLAAGIDCYEIKILDSYGDGMSLTGGGADAGWEVIDANGTILSSDLNPNFGSEAVDNFGADAAVSIDDLSINNVAIYPNPVNDHANIDFTLTESSIVNIAIVNVLGETVNNKTYNLVAGNNQVNFDVSNVNSGVYFIQLDINGQTKTQKITIVK